MSSKRWQPLFEVALISAVAFLIHTLVFYLKPNPILVEQLYYTLPQLYSFFVTCSFIIVFVLILVKQRNIDYVGYSFMLLTVLKMIVSYFYLLPILQLQNQNIRFEKINFFVVFALFLTMETVVTARILNNKQ